MSIKVNVNPTKVTVYDEDKLIHANGEEIVHLISNKVDDIKDHLINIISDSLELGDSEIELYKFITAYQSRIYTTHPSDDILELSSIIKICAEYNDKSLRTYDRAAHQLIMSGVIKYIDTGLSIKIVDRYDITKINGDIKYILIEVQPR